MEPLRTQREQADESTVQKAYQPPVVDKLQKLVDVTGIISTLSGTNDG
jgi:hypothetical protein